MVVNNDIPLDVYNEIINQHIKEKILQPFMNAIPQYDVIQDIKIYNNPTERLIYITSSIGNSVTITSLQINFSTEPISQGTLRTYHAAFSTPFAGTKKTSIGDLEDIKNKLSEKILSSILDGFAQFFSEHTSYATFTLNYSDNSLSISLYDDQNNEIATKVLNINVTSAQHQHKFILEGHDDDPR